MDSDICIRHKVDLERMLLDESTEPTRLALSLLEDITNCFSDDEQIGSGGFAMVYKGMVGKGMVAVKKLSNTFGVHENKFYKEVECLMKTRNSLEKYPALADDHMVPKIADFGLSRCLDKEQTRASTLNPCGSMGYLAPESFGGKLTFASDIYSLGVIIMEIMTGEKGYPEVDVVKTWMNRLEGSDQMEAHLEQVRVCIKIGMECIDSDPKKRPVARHVKDRLDKITSTMETGISSSSFEQVSLLKEQCCEEKVAKLSSEYLGKDIKEHAETEELAKYIGAPKEDHWQQIREKAPGDQWSLWGAQDTNQNVIPHWQQGREEVPGDQWPLWGAQDTKRIDIPQAKQFGHLQHKSTQELRAVRWAYIGEDKNCETFRKGELKPFLKDKNLIGKGRYGEVYRGLVDDFAPVVVRKLISGTVPEDGGLFPNEVEIQCRVIHKNIVRLIGCCLEVDTPMLVYEFLSRGSLSDILHSNKVSLNLDLRLSIAAKSSHGLAYMHSMASSSNILHGNFRPSNILLNDNFEPKISDFGMSRMAVPHTGIVAGDMVYMDPVYLQTGVLTKQGDVYSFGVTILELVTRKRANSLVRIFLENHKQGKKSTDLFDKQIAVTEDLELLDTLARIAVECLNHDEDLRPTMVDVAKRLSILNRSRNVGGLVDASTSGV
uniref:Wall-associated receptor kinase 5 n=1 Tax=Aegilops tauschii TaxID=37682 RepID=M8BVL9_AEGTA